MKIQKDIITSRQNNLVKWAASLGDKKGRAEASAFIVEGVKLTLEAADTGLPVSHIFVSEDKMDKYLTDILKAFSAEQYKDTEVYILSEGAFSKISTEKSPQGVISVIKYLDFFRELDIIYKEDFLKWDNERAIALYSVRDPGNLGAVIRSSVAFGVDRIIVSADCADIYNSRTIRSAMGSLFKVKIDVISDFSSFITAAREAGRRVFAAELTDRAVSLSEAGVTSTDIFVIGNEGHGIDLEVSSLCNGSVYIPISEHTESLNASVAAAIFMWEQSK